MTFGALCAAGFLFGIGFGYFVQRAGLCFAHGLTEIYMGTGRRIVRLFLVIFILTSVGFSLAGCVTGTLCLKPIGQLRGHGLLNVVSGIVFGAGICLNGGCILGTLRQIGEGNMTFVVVLLSFIPGMAFVVYVLDPLFLAATREPNALLPSILGNIPAFWVTGTLALLGLIALVRLDRSPRIGNAVVVKS